MQEITLQEAQAMLREYLRSRSDIGVGNAIRAAILEPPNPFETASPRKPQRWFVVLLIILCALLGTFAYFNLWN